MVTGRVGSRGLGEELKVPVNASQREIRINLNNRFL